MRPFDGHGEVQVDEPSMSAPPAAPRVGVGVLVVDEAGRALLTLRRRPPEAGCWSILGGRVEAFEPLERCAMREAREEAGIDVVLEGLLCVTNHILPSEGQHWVSPAYLGRIIGGNPHNCEPDKTAEVRWFDATAMPANLTQTARNALAAYRRQFATRRLRGAE
jgi:8-oxo-dGTP diphosphatase